MNPTKKILIITYYWPPAGGPGVQRWLKFVKYLPQFGWKPTVFVPENPSYPIVDETLSSEVASDTEIIKTRIWEPYQIAEFFGKENKKFKAGQFDVAENQSWKSKLSIWVRGNFFIPDARKFWVKPSVKYLEHFLQTNPFDAVVTTGPPHSVHLIGLGLKKIFPDLKWIADFRDPWTEISYYKHLKLSPVADKKHRDLEKEVFKKADITLATSFSDAANFRKMGANAFCITNGFDSDLSEGKNKEKNTKFTLSYIGVLEQLRNPEILWLVLAEIIKADRQFRQDLEIKFVGKVDNKILHKFNDFDLINNVNDIGYLPHAVANEEMKKADLLLLTNFPEESSAGIIPGKIFEYLASGNKMISFGPKNSDVMKILDETNAGKHFAYDEMAEVKTFILQQYHNWKDAKNGDETRNIAQFSRKNLTAKLAQILSN